jgi:hypothetical protein
MGLVPFKNETETYHSICIASMKYLRDHPLVFPYSLKDYVYQAKVYSNIDDYKIRDYCDHLICKYQDRLSLTDLELFELSNILFSIIKWSPDFNGLVQLQDFNERLFSIELNFKQIDKITLDLSKSILVNYKEGNNTFIKYTSVLDSKPKASEGADSESQDKKNSITPDSETIDKKIKEVELMKNFEEPEHALKFVLSQPMLAAYGGYDLKSMSDEEIIEIANDMLFAMRLSVEKLKKKHK